jgi:hypothetical protein
VLNAKSKKLKKNIIYKDIQDAQDKNKEYSLGIMAIMGIGFTSD